MRTSFIMQLMIVTLIVVGNDAFTQQRNSTKWTAKTAKKWVTSKEWANGSMLNLHTSVNYLEFAKQYHVNKGNWDKAFAFLNDKKLDTLQPGKYIIDGNDVYAIITEAPSKAFNFSSWESHRNYIDLQHVIKGKEKIGVAPVSLAKVTKPYDETKDAANYDVSGNYYIATPKEFFLFFPGDAHRPNIKVDGYDTVKKLVIKIKFTP
ncbi:MAG: YhcH/YjgK/YiaL family protein [Mucilaginibacter sp.]